MAERIFPEGAITLRNARPTDYAFAARLYRAGMRQRLVPLGLWDAQRVAARFRRGFKAKQAKVIRLRQIDIGWIQVAETRRGFHIKQLHLVDRFRNNGIGTQLIRSLQDRARRAGKPVALNVIRGNPAAVLYRRLGFRVIRKGEEKMHMRWVAPRVSRV